MKFLNRASLIACLAGVFLSPACTKKKPADSATSSTGEGGKKIFYHYRTSEEKTLDPMKQFDQASHNMVHQFYDTLLDYHYLKRPYELTPGLLEKMPEKQADGTYKLTLRKGVFFHDNACFPGGKGRELNADDVIFSIKRFSDANVNDLSYSIIGGLIDGIDAFREASRKAGKAFDYSKTEISGLKKIDNLTLSIKFTAESPLNFYPLAFGGLVIMAPEAVQKYGQDIDKNPVGTGPFTLKSYSRRGTTILQKNPRYWDHFPAEGNPEDADIVAEGAGRQLPLVDEVHLPLIEEPQPQMLKFKKGQLHWVAVNKDDFNTLVDRIPNTREFKLKPDVEKQFKLYTAPYLSTSYWKFGMRDSLIGKNKALRQAMAYAFNSEGFIDLMLNGRGFPADSIVPAQIAGSWKDSGSTWYRQDLEMAKKKLAEAGFPEGKGLPKLVVEFRSTTKEARQQFEYFRNEFAKVGIQIEGNFQTFSNFLQKTNAGNYQIADAGWNADYPDAENFYALLYSENRAPLPNDGNFENKKYDELYRKSRNMPAGPERSKIFAEMDAIVKEEVPVILVMNQVSMGLLQNDVRLFKRHALSEATYKYLDLKK